MNIQMKKWFWRVIYTLGALSLLMIGIVIYSIDMQQEPAPKKEQVTQEIARLVGYYKADNKLRYRTFNLTSTPTEADLRSHATSQFFTEGQTSVCFYYTSNAPDISGSRTASIANDIAHDARPYAAVWVNGSKDRVQVIYNPK